MEDEASEIANLDELLRFAGDNLNIFQDEVDFTVQQQFLNTLKRFSKNPEKCEELRKKYAENIQDLFDENVSEQEKKKMLVILSTIDDVSIFRTIESISQQEGPLQKWAIIAAQQSRMLLQSNLLDTPGVFISSGLGGRGQLLRYFCVFFYNHLDTLQPFQQNTVRNETDSIIRNAGGEVESIEFKEKFVISLVLLPLQADLSKAFSDILDECNQYGNFLHPNIIITNVRKLTDEEIRETIPQSYETAED